MKSCLIYPGIENYRSRQKMFECLGNTIEKEFIITDYIGNKNKPLTNENERVAYIGLYEHQKLKPIFMYDIYKKLDELLRYNDIDIIHDYFYNSILSNALHRRLHSHEHEYPKVVTSIVSRNIGWYKEISKLEPYPSVRYSYLRWVNIFLEYISCKQADGIMVNSEEIKQDLIKYSKINPDIIRVIPNSVDVDYFRPNCVKKDQLGLNPEENILLFVGNVFRLKGIYDLLDALPKVLIQEPNTRLIIIGSIHKDELQYLSNYIKERKIESNILFLNHMSQDELIKYYSVADVFVFPSLYEGSPRAVQEAIACGCPVVATNIGGINILDENHEYISFVNIKSPDMISKKVLELLKDSNLAKAKAKKGIHHIQQEFSNKNVAGQIVEFYNHLVG
ncbi:hypothetical protein BGV40_09120 [Methanosarcina sp. Ant1]|nr:hypothetical protein BGV40_09120 [Methanosarcina sp. Ant1]